MANSTDLAVLESRELAKPDYGERFTAPLRQAAPFSEGISRHHRQSYDDYETAKAHILQALGDLSDLNVTGKQIVVAVFCRPNFIMFRGPTGEEAPLYTTVKEVKEDWYQHKGGLIVKAGPGAFQGDKSYLQDTFGDAGAPGVGDWIFSNASAGIQVNLAGDGASRPQALDRRGEPMDIFEWDGWPCRIMLDTSVMMWIRGDRVMSVNPQSVV